MNDYLIGIIYATGCLIYDKSIDKKYVVVRNIDSYYPQQISIYSGYKTYVSNYYRKKINSCQYVVKARNINYVPELNEINMINDFCRAYIEISGAIDKITISRKSGKIKKNRLRIYGSEEVISFINNNLPARPKSIQYISNKVDEKYIGETCAIYFQSDKEIRDILYWINGSQRNEKIWDKWNDILNAK